MTARNPKYNQDGSIDMELEHPTFGWIPFTASKNDVMEHGRAIYEAAQAGQFGTVTPYEEPTNE